MDQYQLFKQLYADMQQIARNHHSELRDWDEKVYENEFEMYGEPSFAITIPAYSVCTHADVNMLAMTYGVGHRVSASSSLGYCAIELPYVQTPGFVALCDENGIEPESVLQEPDTMLRRMSGAMRGRKDDAV